MYLASQGQAIRNIASVVTDGELAVLRLRVAGASFRRAAAELGVSKARAFEAETKAARRIRSALDDTPALTDPWSALLGRGITDEANLLGAVADQETLELGRVVLWAGLGARTARWGGDTVPGYWMAPRDSLDARMGRLVESMPLADADVSAVANGLGVPAPLALTLLQSPTSPVSWSTPGRGWVRRRAPTRDAAVLCLRRWGRPTTAAVLARVLQLPRSALLDQLRRDERFVRLPARGQWGLASTTDIDERHRTTGEAISAALRTWGPLSTADLLRHLRATYPVSDTSVRRWLRHQEFGRLDDGRWGFVVDGARPHVEDSPSRPANVNVWGHRIHFTVAVTDDVVRGSWIPIPPYVGWWVGLRRIPSRRSFRRDDGGPDLLVARRPGHTSISSLRSDLARLGNPVATHLSIWLDVSRGSARVEATYSQSCCTGARA